MRACLLLLSSCTAAALATQDEVRTTREVYLAELPDLRGEQEWIGCRVLDVVTGKPIAGADLFLVDESETPLPQKFWSVRQAKSDQDGFVRVRIDDLKKGKDRGFSWVFLEAPGYGASTEFSWVRESVWYLGPARDLPLQVCDWRGRPVAGAGVSFCGGCGHTPDLAYATTGEGGMALLRGVDVTSDIRDIYISHEDLDLGYRDVTWWPGEPAVVFDCLPAMALTGRLLDREGKPVAGAFIGTREFHRGPWTQTGTDGSFRLFGCQYRNLTAVVSGRTVEFGAPAGFPATLRLPDDADEMNGSIEAAGAPPPSAPGTVAVRVQVLGIDQDRVDHEQVTVALRTPRGMGTDDATELFDVPDAGPFAFVLSDGSDRRVYAFENVAALPPQPLQLRWFGPTQVRATVVDPEGNAVAVTARLADDFREVKAVDGRVDLPLRCRHWQTIELLPERSDLRRRRINVLLPPRRDGAVVDLGRIVMSCEPMLRVLDAQGAPAKVDKSEEREGSRASLVRRACTGAGKPFAWSGLLDDAGGWLGPDPEAGDAVLITPAGSTADEAGEERKVAAEQTIAVRSRTVLEGKGPWTIRLPAGELALKVVDADERPVEKLHVYLEDLDYFPRAATVVFTHLAAGEHKVFLAAPGRQSAVVKVQVPAIGRKDLHVVLPPL